MPHYPYISGQAALVQAFTQLRNNFPGKVDAGYLKRFSIAPANESYIISILRFLGLISEDGTRVEDETGYFYGNNESFQSGLEDALRKAYSQLFDEMGEDALSASKDNLAPWFRASDKTSDLVGQRQASTFQTLAALAGHGDLPAVRSGAAKKTSTAPSGAAAKKTTTPKKTTPKNQAEKPGGGDGGGGDGGGGDISVGVKNRQDVGLTVRIEVNLPPDGSAETYDLIFASIKKHLMS